MRCVYFARKADGTGPIKIGCSNYPKGRVKQLGSLMGAKLTVLAQARGDETAERNLHTRFAANRVDPPSVKDIDPAAVGKTEWFRATPELLGYIADVIRERQIILFVNPTPDRERLIAKRIKAGETQTAIARDLGITAQRVSQLVKKHEKSLLDRKAAA